MPATFYYYLVLFVLLNLNHVERSFAAVEGIADDSRDLVLTPKEKNALDTFKGEVVKSLPQGFMKTDFYLLRWLRVASWDIPLAKSLLRKNLEWRAREKIDQILKEDFSDIPKEYSLAVGNISDVVGRPVLSFDFGKMDIHREIARKRFPRLERFLKYAMEKGMHEILKAQKQALEKNGNVVTQGIIVANGEGANLKQHFCVRCLPIFFEWLHQMEAYYPRFIKELVVINLPKDMLEGFKGVMPLTTDETQSILKLFGTTDKNEWMRYLEQRMDTSELKF